MATRRPRTSWEEAHRAFGYRLLKSHKYVLGMAALFWGAGYRVDIEPPEVSPRVEEARDYTDTGDFWVLMAASGQPGGWTSMTGDHGDRWRRFEVKARTAEFTCAEDWEYRDYATRFMVVSCRYWDTAEPRPTAIFCLNPQINRVAIVRSDSYRHWERRWVWMSNTKKHEEVYIIDPDRVTYRNYAIAA